MIEIIDLTKSYGDKILFDKFNLKINKNTTCILLGASGCDKSTLINMIGAIEEFDSGKIIVNGIDISNKKKST